MMIIPNPVEEILLQLEATALGDDGNIDDETRRAARKSARIIRNLYEYDEVHMEESHLDS